MTALRSFVAVADSGGVTRASGFLNLTQSAVSMQLKRLEEALDLNLIDRSARTVSLTGSGEQLLSYARRMLALNDEVITRMTDSAYEGEVVLGVPHDIVYPAVPRILHSFAAEFPRVRVRLISLATRDLKSLFARGKCDFILTTEDGLDAGGETLVQKRLVWVGAVDGTAFRARPLRLAFCTRCIFRAGAQTALDDAGISWDMAVEADSDRVVEATVAADLGVSAVIEGTESPHAERIPPSAGLPELKRQNINLYRPTLLRGAVEQSLSDLIRRHYRVSRPAD